MLDPMNPFHKLLGRLLQELPHNRRNMEQCYQRYRPILKPAFPFNPAAMLLVCRTIAMIEGEDISGAYALLDRLRPACQAGTDAERALFCILHGLCAYHSRHYPKVNTSFNAACKYGHDFYDAYLLHGNACLHHIHLYGKAETHYNRALDCLCRCKGQLEPEQERALTAGIYASIAHARVMMHRPDDAKDALRIAESLHADESQLLPVQALLHASLHEEADAAACLARLSGLRPDLAKDLATKVGLMLRDEHPHFTALPLGSPEGFAAFWQNFLDRETDVLLRLDSRRFNDARALIHPPLAAMDPFENDFYFFTVLRRENKDVLELADGYSRTYAVFLDQLAATCPPEIRGRWCIERKS